MIEDLNEDAEAVSKVLTERASARAAGKTTKGTTMIEDSARDISGSVAALHRQNVSEITEALRDVLGDLEIAVNISFTVHDSVIFTSEQLAEFIGENFFNVRSEHYRDMSPSELHAEMERRLAADTAVRLAMLDHMGLPLAVNSEKWQVTAALDGTAKTHKRHYRLVPVEGE